MNLKFSGYGVINVCVVKRYVACLCDIYADLKATRVCNGMKPIVTLLVPIT